MKTLKLNKKGFTIVELVIVIAVIAILAAVLIPTFTSLVNEANKSADEQAVANINKLLQTDETLNGKPQNIDEVKAILEVNNYADELTTYYKGYSLAWIKTSNKVVLVENSAVVYPENCVGETNFEYFRIVATASSLANGFESGGTVYVSSDITLTEELTPTEAGEYELKLDGNTLTSSQDVGAWTEGAKLTLSDGTIKSENDQIAVYAGGKAALELNNVTVQSAAGANPLQCYGADMILNNVTTVQSGNNDAAWYNSAIQVINRIVKDQATNKWQVVAQANTTVNSGSYAGKIAIQISAPGGNVTINGGNFNGTQYVLNADFAPQNYLDGNLYQSKVIINGGTFNGNIKISAATVCVINGGTFSVDVGNVANVSIGTGKTVVNNNDGTWTVR